MTTYAVTEITIKKASEESLAFLYNFQAGIKLLTALLLYFYQLQLSQAFTYHLKYIFR